MEREKSLFKSWVEAARPKTLPASLSPVLLACVLAWCEGVFRFVPALLCFGVALLASHYHLHFYLLIYLLSYLRQDLTR